jgi:hypothetical protein
VPYSTVSIALPNSWKEAGAVSSALADSAQIVPIVPSDADLPHPDRLGKRLTMTARIDHDTSFLSVITKITPLVVASFSRRPRRNTSIQILKNKTIRRV